MKYLIQHTTWHSHQQPPTRSSSNSKLINLVGTGIDFIPSEVSTLRAVIFKGILIQQISIPNCTIKSIVKEIIQLILTQWQKSNNDFKPPVN